MPRKLLVIGLGSSGTAVCEHLADAIRWEFGDLGRVPFVRLLGIETDSRVTNPHFPVIPISLTASDLAAVSSSLDAAPSIGLRDWFADGMAQAKGSVEDGAGNIRMLGRLAFLWPDNYAHVEAAVLRILRTDEAGVPGLTQVNAGLVDTTVQGRWGANFALPNRVSVYVVGSLCGGTASGSFIDLGYLLRVIIANLGNAPVQTVAFLTVPPGTGADAAHYANAYAALEELNYYLTDGQVYRQKLHGHGDYAAPNALPFDWTYLVAPPGLGTEQLHRALSHYLYMDAFVDGMGEKDARRSDWAAFERAGDGYGFPQRVATLGLASVEYPAPQVAKACGYTLLQKALEEWLAPPPEFGLPAHAIKAGWDALSAIHTLPDTQLNPLEAALCTTAGADGQIGRPLDAIAGDLLPRSGADLRAFGFTALLDAEERIRMGFGDLKPDQTDVEQDKSFRAGCVREVLSGRRSAVLSDLKRRVDDLVAAQIASVYSEEGSAGQDRRGPRWCLALLSQIREGLSATLKSLDPDQVRARVEQSVEDLDYRRGIVGRHLEDALLALSGLKTYFVNRYYEDYQEAFRKWLHWRFRQELISRLQARDHPGGSLGAIYSELIAYVSLLEGRAGRAVAYLEAMKLGAAHTCAGVITEAPQTVGVPLFQGQQTIDQAYAGALGSLPGRAGRAWSLNEEDLIQAFAGQFGARLSEDLRAAPGHSFFDLQQGQGETENEKYRLPWTDPRPQVHSPRVIADRAFVEGWLAPHFVSVASTDIVKLFCTRANWMGELQDVTERAALLLPLRSQPEGYVSGGLTRSRFWFVPAGADPAATQQLVGVIGRNPFSTMDGRTWVHHGQEPYRITVLNEQGGFPVRIAQWMSPDPATRQVSYCALGATAPLLLTRHSRQLPAHAPWLPATLEDRFRLAQCEETYIWALVLGIAELEPRGGNWRIEIGLDSLGQPEHQHFPPHFPTAVRALYLDGDLGFKLEKKVLEERRGGDSAAVQRWQDFGTNITQGAIVIAGLDRAAFLRLFERCKRKDAGFRGMCDVIIAPTPVAPETLFRQAGAPKQTDSLATYVQSGIYCPLDHLVTRCEDEKGAAAVALPQFCPVQTCTERFW